MSRYFPKEDIQMANKHMERCSASLVIRKTPMKTTMRHHFILSRMTEIKTADNKKLGRMWIY